MSRSASVLIIIRDEKEEHTMRFPAQKILHFNETRKKKKTADSDTTDCRAHPPSSGLKMSCVNEDNFSDSFH